LAQGGLDAAIAYTKEREQFGKPIASFQNTQFMLADMAMKIEAARLMVYTAAANAERGVAPGGQKLGFMAAAAKTYASDVAMEVTTNADRKSTRLNSSHVSISYAVFCLKKKNN